LNALGRECDLEIASSIGINPFAGWAIVWGYDAMGCAQLTEPGNYDGGNNWYPSCGDGWHVPWIAHYLYNNIGQIGLNYTHDMDSIYAHSIIFDSTTAIDSFPRDTFQLMPYDSRYYTPDSSFTMVTIDPYREINGAISMIIVNRDTTDLNTITCNLSSEYSIEFDSVEVWKLGINDSIWREACRYVYFDSTFLPDGFAHNGFTYCNSENVFYYRTSYVDSDTHNWYGTTRIVADSIFIVSAIWDDSLISTQTFGDIEINIEDTSGGTGVGCSIAVSGTSAVIDTGTYTLCEVGRVPLGEYLRYQPVYLDSCDQIHAIDTTIITDSSSYVTIILDPMSFARVRVKPVKDNIDIVLYPGWNLVSIPMFTGDALLRNLFATTTSGDSVCPDTTMWVLCAPFYYDSISISYIMRWTTFGYESGLFFPQTADYSDSANTPGESYWIYLRSISGNPCTVSVAGVKCAGYIIPLSPSIGSDFPSSYYDYISAGHINLIGSVWEESMFSNNSDPCSLLYDSTSVWSFNADDSTYELVRCIEPTEGYVMLSKGKGSWTFPDTALECTTSTFMEITHDDLYYSLYCPPGMCDTASLDVEISPTAIFVTDRNAVNNPAVENCMVWIETEDTVVIGYTNQDGIYRNSFIDINDSTYIFLYKPGYRKLLVYPYGSIDNDTFRSDIVIFGDITIGSDDTLVILPGTNVYAAYRSDALGTWMADRIDIVNQGHIIAVGNSLAPITFTVDFPPDSTPAPNDWKGIVHHYYGSGIYEYCRFEYMRYFHGHQPGGDVDFKDCTFANTYACAFTYGGSGPVGYDKPTVTFEDCNFDTIGVWNAVVLTALGDSSYMKHCSFDSCASYAFDILDSSHFVVEACTLNNCYGALRVRAYASVDVADCDLRVSNSWLGWRIESAGTLYVENSLFSKDCAGLGPVINGGYAEFRYCSITDFTVNGVGCEGTGYVDLGTYGDLGHNCIWSDHASANRLYTSSAEDTIYAHGNWIDTLICGGDGEFDTGDFFPPDSCDTTVAKVIAAPDERKQSLPIRFELGAAIPNPFNNTVSFEYSIPFDCEIEIKIFDVLGKIVRTLVDGPQKRGVYKISWNGTDNIGKPVSSGTYLYRLKSEDFEESKKMTLIK